MIEAGRRRGPLLWSGAVGGFAVVTAAAITGGLLWGERGPAAGAAPDDQYATTPSCAEVPAEVVESAVSAGKLVTDTAGPLPEAVWSSCVWSSADGTAAEPRMLTVAFHAHFTDRSGQVSGESRAEAELDALTRVSQGIGEAPASADLGGEALLRPGTVDLDAAEAVFRDGNLVVRVWYGGQSYDQAREGVIAVAEGIFAAL